MAKFIIEDNTADRRGIFTCGGTNLWKVGSNYVLVYFEYQKLKYRYSSDGTTWTNEVILIDLSSTETTINESTTWYKSISGVDILYIVYRLAGLSSDKIYITKWNISTINSPSQIGSSYNLTDSSSWIPTWHHKLLVDYSGYLWISGMTLKLTGSDYHDYYTIKSTNVVNNSNDNDISAWGTPLNIGTVDNGYDMKYGGVCFLASSSASAKMLFGYLAWTGSINVNFHIRWGDGGNLAGNWTPNPPTIGTNIAIVTATGLESFALWRQGTSLHYSPSGLPGKVWVCYSTSSGLVGRRFDIETQTYPYAKTLQTTVDQFNGITVVSYGGFDTVFVINDDTYIQSVQDEQSASLTAITTLDNVGPTTHKGVVVPLSVTDPNDVILVYTET